jgi:peptidoglycan/xylan/chitin deacetylase (PgdA/CDA1 family)
MIPAGALAFVLMYHHVSSRAADGPYGRALTVSPQEFEGQLQLLKGDACSVVGLHRVVDDVRTGRLQRCEVALTFDDGYADAATVALPLLLRYQAVGTFFVTTGFLGTAGHLSPAGVRRLAGAGMEIGAHTVTHADLTLLSAADVRSEIRRSRTVLQALSGQPVGAFAYPAGSYDASVEAAVQAAGFDLAVSTDAGVLSPAALRRDIYALPRYRILRGRGEVLLQQLIAPLSSRAAMARSSAALRSVARKRSEGNAPQIAERVGIALLSGDFPEQILKVKVLKSAPAVVAGIMLSGVKFHARVSRQTFEADVSEMIYRAFTADASISEVDVWAVTPLRVGATAIVSGDLAVPTDRTVFSAAVARADWVRDATALGTTYWDPDWSRSLR